MTAERHYYPANGTEGRAFKARWCDHCALDTGITATEFGEFEGCLVRAGAAFDQPPEWVYRHGVPWCLAYTEDKANPARCLFTREMF
jgi:hypothetical protein